MKRMTFALALAALAVTGPALATGDLTKTDVTVVTLEMGSNDDGMYFKPNHFEFETGKAYKMILTNVDEIKHEVELGQLPHHLFTRKVEIRDQADQLIAEVKGAIHEMEVGAGKSYEWFFVPLQPIENAAVECAIPGHREAGMIGTVTIK